MRLQVTHGRTRFFGRTHGFETGPVMYFCGFCVTHSANAVSVRSVSIQDLYEGKPHENSNGTGSDSNPAVRCGIHWTCP